jgi:uncharacterized membrane protein
VTKKKQKRLSSREQRQLRTRQILFAAIAILVIASFVLSLIRY